MLGNRSIRYWSFIIAVGIFATTLSQPTVLSLPLRFVLRNDLSLSPTEMSMFFAFGTAPWYLKVIFGLLSDSVPIFGSKRRSYLLLGSFFSALFWLLLGWVPKTVMPLIICTFCINTMLVIASTVTGGLLVEVGQRLNAVGRLVTVRIIVTSTCTLVAGPLAGQLALLPFESATAIGAIIAFTLSPVALFFVSEPSQAKSDAGAFVVAGQELKRLVSSPTVWLITIFLFLADAPRGFSTALFYHQTSLVNIPPEDIGYLNAFWSAGGLLAAGLYYTVLCRWLSPLSRLALGVLCGAMGIVIHMFYNSIQTAIFIHAVGGFFFAITTLAFWELAVWSSPKSAEAMGLAIFMSALNVGQTFGDYMATQIMAVFGVNFFGIIELYASLMLLTLLFLPFLPANTFLNKIGLSGT